VVYLGKRRLAEPADGTVPLPRITAEPEEGWIADYYRRLRLAAVIPADAAIQSELSYLRTWAGVGTRPGRLALPPPAKAAAGNEPRRRGQPDEPRRRGRPDEPRRRGRPDEQRPAAPDQTAVLVPRLAPGVERLGEYQGSGLAEATYLVRHPGGQVVQLSRLLHLVLTQIDGHRTVAGIAEQVTAAFGRTVSVGNIEFLLANKLAPLGLLDAGEAGEAGEPGTGAPRQDGALLALKLHRTLIPAAGVQFLARAFKPLFNPFVVVLVLACLVVTDTWLFRGGRVLPSLEYVLSHPLMVLVVLGLTLVSTLFHECGHAAACRYGGARPGVIGVGFFVMWPAFFTSTTDAYRLGRAGRVRTDLGGVYFNAIFALALAAAYRVTGYEVLAGAVVLTHVEIIQQLMPSLRFDGYFILADLIGVPDLFRRIGPTLRSLVPGQPQDPRVRGLKRPARLALTAWVMVIVPLLGTEMAVIIVNGPTLVSTFAHSLNAQAQAAATQFGRTEIAAGLVTIISIVLLVLPMAGLTYILLHAGQGVFRRTAIATRGRPGSRALAVVAALAVGAGLAFHWGLLPLHGGGATPRPSAVGDVTTQRPASAPPAAAPIAGRPGHVHDRGPGRRHRPHPHLPAHPAGHRALRADLVHQAAAGGLGPVRGGNLQHRGPRIALRRPPRLIGYDAPTGRVPVTRIPFFLG
jgi:putative peptide zinc metalloprotease protein